MKTIWIIAIALFLVITFLFWKLTNDYFKKEHGEKAWKQWTTRLYYWQFAIYASTGVTMLTLFLLKWANVLTF